MPTNASAFSNNPICLRAMGENIRSRKLLYDLCLVDKLFNAEFSPYLYRAVTVASKEHLASLLNSDYLRYVLCFEGLSACEALSQQDDIMPELVAKLPSLEQFVWKAPLSQTRIDAVCTSGSTLKSIVIDYPEDMEEREMGMTFAEDEAQRDEPDEDTLLARSLYMQQNLTGFANLEALTITNIYGDLRRWRRQLVQMLTKSPSLRHLSLSLSDHVVERNYHDGHFEMYMDFFDHMCKDFGRSGASPLSLRSLHCGSAMLPTSLESIKKLTDLAYLEELYIYNRDVSTHTDWLIIYDEDDTSQIIFDAFLSDNCPRLRRFSAYQIRKDVFEALSSEQASALTPQLGISFECHDMGDEGTWQLLRADPEVPTLPRQLRMMDLDLDLPEEDVSVQDVLDDLVATNAETLEGLAVNLPDPADVDEIDALKTSLNQLPHLAQLVIVSKDGAMEPLSDQATRLAEDIANAVPQLRYIGVCGLFWFIWRVGDDETPARLERLAESRERDHVELFVHTSFSP